MSVKTNGTLIFMIEKKLRGKEGLFQVIAAKTQVLVKAQGLLTIEMDVQQFARVDRLSELMIRVQPGHFDVGSFGVDAAHVGMIEGGDEGQYAAHGRQIQIAARLIGFRL